MRERSGKFSLRRLSLRGDMNEGTMNGQSTIGTGGAVSQPDSSQTESRHPEKVCAFWRRKVLEESKAAWEGEGRTQHRAG